MRSPSRTWKLARLPLSSSLPSPRLSTFPCFGFSLALSGRTMPPAVFSSASRRLTTILSFSGTTFIPNAPLRVSRAGLPSAPPAVVPGQGVEDGVQHDVLAAGLGDDAVHVGHCG